jgi:hypothetical protein
VGEPEEKISVQLYRRRSISGDNIKMDIKKYDTTVWTGSMAGFVNNVLL